MGQTAQVEGIKVSIRHLLLQYIDALDDYSEGDAPDENDFEVAMIHVGYMTFGRNGEGQRAAWSKAAVFPGGRRQPGGRLEGGEAAKGGVRESQGVR